MGKKKGELKKPKLTLREAAQSQKEFEFRGKIGQLVDFFNQETPCLKNLKPSKLAILTLIYYKFKSVHDAHFDSGHEKYKGKYKRLFKVYEKINSPGSEYADPIEESKKIFELPDDLLVSIFSSFLSSEWTPIKDPTDVLILLEVMLVYVQYLEELVPRPIVYKMDVSTMQLIWNALSVISALDKKGRHSDRTYESNQTKRAGSEKKRREKIISSWNKLQNKKGSDLIGQMTRNGIATWIKKDLKRSSHKKEYQASINTIISSLEAHFLESNQIPPWKKTVKSVQKAAS